MRRASLLAFLFLCTCAIILNVEGQCGTGGCGGADNWYSSARAFLDSDMPIVGVAQKDTSKLTSFRTGIDPDNSTSKEAQGPAKMPSMKSITILDRSDQFPKGKILNAVTSIPCSDIIMDVSNTRGLGQARIDGSILIRSKDFLNDKGDLKSSGELAKILGDDGISRGDPIVLYSDEFSSGEAAFVFWLMTYLGHSDAKVLDGGFEDWVEASLPLDTAEIVRSKTEYIPSPRSEMLANYSFIKSVKTQVIDARSYQEFGTEHIPNAFFINPEQVMSAGKLRNSTDLDLIFVKLDKNKPIVVYADDLINASLIWFALQIMDFDSKIYIGEDSKVRKEPEIYKIS
ncbi:MAG: hypothetical protein MUO26_11685 [Methanotrichaceae archaeon]|nr:hypothetical protein [Methanotrichaceae archaeon]